MLLLWDQIAMKGIGTKKMLYCTNKVPINETCKFFVCLRARSFYTTKKRTETFSFSKKISVYPDFRTYSNFESLTWLELNEILILIFFLFRYIPSKISFYYFGMVRPSFAMIHYIIWWIMSHMNVNPLINLLNNFTIHYPVYCMQMISDLCT